MSKHFTSLILNERLHNHLSSLSDLHLVKRLLKPVLLINSAYQSLMYCIVKLYTTSVDIGLKTLTNHIKI